MSDVSVEEHPDVIAGAVVRELVDRNEREIEVLQHVLEAALQEAENAEKLVAVRSASHPAADELAPLSARPGRPRTTVVTRTYAGEAGEPGSGRP
jgi:hypothetical protein